MLKAAIVLAYLAVVGAVSLRLSGRQDSARGFLRGEGDLPWWSVCLSIVATETSTLTVISVPGIAYGHGLVFVGLGAGYLLGRALVAWKLLPLYMRGDAVSAYEYLGRRFGGALQKLAALTFLVTRLFAEGVRLAASALPIAALLAAAHAPVGPGWIIAGLTIATLAYTLAGGLRAVVWSDSVQFAVYATGALACVAILWAQTGPAALHEAWQAGRLQLFEAGAPILSSPYAPLTALVGGAALSMASHGADQLMVQRVLACRSLREGRIALVASAVVVSALFALLSAIGVLLWARHDGAPLAALGLASSDALYPAFIATGLPPLLSGLLIAGILAASMGSLSAALNAMAASSLGDLLGGADGWLARRVDERGLLSVSRWLTLGWGLAMAVCAAGFSASAQPVVVLGLTIAGYSYGALLGAFVFGMVARGAGTAEAMTGFVCTLAGVAVLTHVAALHGWTIAFPWLVPIGVALYGLAGGAALCVRRLLPRTARGAR